MPKIDGVDLSFTNSSLFMALGVIAGSAFFLYAYAEAYFFGDEIAAGKESFHGEAEDKGLLDAAKEIDAEMLVASGVLKQAYDGIRLLGKGELKAKVTIKVAGASEAAKAAVEKAGVKYGKRKQH